MPAVCWPNCRSVILSPLGMRSASSGNHRLSGSSQESTPASCNCVNTTAVNALLMLPIFAAALGCAPIPTATPEPTALVEVPVTIRNGLILVPVHVDGIERELTFLLDSGAPTLIDASIAEELGVGRPADLSLTDAAGGELAVTTMLLGGLRVGDLHMSDVSAVAGQPRNNETAQRAGELAVDGAVPLRYNGYKVPLMRNLVARAIRGTTTAATT